jgi:hypothetical protein
VDEVTKRCTSSCSTLYLKSDYDRERQMLVFASPVSKDDPAKLMIFDVDPQSREYSQVSSS